MAVLLDVTDSVVKTSCKKLLETVERFLSQNIAVQKLQPTEAKLPD